MLSYCRPGCNRVDVNMKISQSQQVGLYAFNNHILSWVFYNSECF